MKQEVKQVFGRVTTALETLKNEVGIARGYASFRFVGGIEQEVQSISHVLKLAKPTDLCPKCRPFAPEAAKRCRCCHDVGMVPKYIITKGT